MSKKEYKVGDKAYFYNYDTFAVKECECSDVVSYNGRSASDDDVIECRFKDSNGHSGPFTLSEIRVHLRGERKWLISQAATIQKFLNDPKNKP